MHISAMFQKELDDGLAVIASGKMQRRRVTAIKITTVDCMRMSCYKFLNKHNDHIPA